MSICIFFIPKPSNRAAEKHRILIKEQLIAALLQRIQHYSVPALIKRLSFTPSFFAKILLLTLFAAFLNFKLQTSNFKPYALTPSNNISMSEKELRPKRIDVFIADVIRISNCSEATASRRIKMCKDALAKTDHQVLTIREYCDYFSYDYEEVLNLLELL